MMRVGLALSAVVLVSCADTARFTSKPGESWCGQVTTATFVRAGMPEGTKLRLELDADSLQSAPGRIWTTPIGANERFVATPLRVIPQILHDPLSTLSFGEGRIKNALTIADLGTTQVIVILSLLQSGEVEVRLIRGASPGSAPAGGVGPPQLFGVFRLAREKGTCGVE